MVDLPNVTVFSDIDDATLLRLYQQSDILFLPLIQCTANNALLEGIACGLPVVSTFLPSVKTYVPGAEALLIKDNDPRKFVETVLYLFHNPEKPLMYFFPFPLKMYAPSPFSMTMGPKLRKLVSWSMSENGFQSE